MDGIDRRRFLKLAGAGGGAVIASSLLHDRLLAGELPAEAATLFEERFGVTKEMMDAVLRAALSKGGSFADLFFEYTMANQVTMEEEMVRDSEEEIILGVGIRVLKDRQTGYGYTSELTLPAMQQAALTAAAIAAGPAGQSSFGLRTLRSGQQVYQVERPFAEASLADRIALIKEGYAAAAAHDPRISKVVVTLTDSLQYVTVANSDGLVVSDVRPQARLRVITTAEHNGTRVTGGDNAGGRIGRAFFETAGTTPKEIGVRAATEAITLLAAVDAVPGDQPVVCGKRSSGVMVHEAVGHPFEGDAIWRKSSIMWDRHGEMVANPLVTIYDDPTIPHLRGSLNIDDEGSPARKVVMIRNGKLTGFLQDRLSAMQLGVFPNGHGRRQSFRFTPQPRMCNTMLAAGDTPPEEIIASVKKGFYAETYQGGMVQGTGKFTFSVRLGYLIEDGKLTAPVKNATLIGTNLQILKEMDMIGSDMGLFLGTCGKDEQDVPVTAGTPTFRIREMTVGGRA